MTYKNRLLHHLAGYRRDVLKVADPGTFHYRGRAVSVEHILPKTQPWLGIPSEARETVRSYAEAQRIKLHRYFHHLNSSQAFALSLFVPFFEGSSDASGALLTALRATGSLQKWKPEAVPVRNEGTNLDAWWSTSVGHEYFCEVKLTEAEFGSAADDARHRKKLSEIYKPRLRAHVKSDRLETAAFFESYQILRNLWHGAGASNAHVVFLYPRQHTVLTDLLNPVLDDITSSLRDRVIVAYAEDVLAHICSDSRCPEALREYAARLVDKYLLATP